jgi:CRISPR-associated exonuclease Cas4
MWLIALVLLAFALLLFWISRTKQAESGLPLGRIVYSDPQLLGKVEKPFFDADFMLTGKPDYLVEQNGDLIPVEVKSGFGPLEPYASHVFQLLAYCLLVESNTGKRPPYGILKYRNRTFAIDYTEAQEQALLELLEDMRLDERNAENRRSHQESLRCGRCGFRSICDQRL